LAVGGVERLAALADIHFQPASSSPLLAVKNSLVEVRLHLPRQLGEVVIGPGERIGQRESWSVVSGLVVDEATELAPIDRP
jgi:hypothetical protein